MDERPEYAKAADDLGKLLHACVVFHRAGNKEKAEHRIRRDTESLWIALMGRLPTDLERLKFTSFL